MVVHACKPSYQGGRRRRMVISRIASKTPAQKQNTNRRAGVLLKR
jgi:hypothetical protein